MHYCPNEAHSPEHWLPRSLGTFGPLQVLNDKICDDCNQALGSEVDQEFTRVGPEAIFRAGLGIEGRHGASKSPFYFRASTTQPLRATNADVSDEETAGLLWETVPGDDGDPQGRLLQQLVVVDCEGNRHAVPFNIEWPAEVLRAAIKHRGIEGAKLREIYLDPEHLERAKPVLSDVFPKFSDVQHFARSGAGQQRRTLLFENRIGPAYFRAVAKIAFHGSLRFVPELSGHEWEFDVLRRFIRRGELPSTNPVQPKKESIVARFGDVFMLRDWGHVIAVEANYTTLRVKLQFFVGPAAVPPTWVVRIGRRPDSVQSGLALAYYAHYLDEPLPDGHAGEMLALDVRKL